MTTGDTIIYRGKRTGMFYGFVRHTRRWHGRQMALVVFDGAARASRVEVRHLQRVPEPNVKEVTP